VSGEPLPRWPADRAGVVAVRDGHLAVIRRVRDGRTYHVVPGGSVEPGESIADAAHREALEELGVSVTLGPLRIRVDHALTRFVQRQWYFEALVGDGDIAVTGPELAYAPERGTYTAVWIPLDAVDSLEVRPAVVAELVARHHADGWPAEVIEIDERPGGRTRP
jgi:8-oxo-dGTP pyrophosphatase MutT (NUDIX family)